MKTTTPLVFATLLALFAVPHALGAATCKVETGTSCSALTSATATVHSGACLQMGASVSFKYTCTADKFSVTNHNSADCSGADNLAGSMANQASGTCPTALKQKVTCGTTTETATQTYNVVPTSQKFPAVAGTCLTYATTKIYGCCTSTTKGKIATDTSACPVRGIEVALPYTIPGGGGVIMTCSGAGGCSGAASLKPMVASVFPVLLAWVFMKH